MNCLALHAVKHQLRRLVLTVRFDLTNLTSGHELFYVQSILS